MKRIQKSNLPAQKAIGEYSFPHFMLFVKDDLPEEIDAKSVVANFHSRIPRHFVSNIDAIYIGQFDFLRDRNLNAMYKDAAIFVTNHQDSEKDLLDDLFHECAHAVENIYGEHIYYDGKIETEFLGKRQKLYQLLEMDEHDVAQVNFLDVDYSLNFDEFLYKQVGYASLTTMTMGLFYSPYSVTSLREYFATGFEAYYYFKEGDYLKKISPKLYEKLFLLETINEDKYN